MVRWFDMEWNPIVPNRENLRRLLVDRRGTALVGIPQLKNDQNRERFNQSDISLEFNSAFTCSQGGGYQTATTNTLGKTTICWRP